MKFKSLKDMAIKFKQELAVYRLVMLDPRTPKISKFMLWMALGYLVSPIDIIPDFIPFLGQLDDLIIIPLLVYMALRFIPENIVSEHRAVVLSR